MWCCCLQLLSDFVACVQALFGVAALQPPSLAHLVSEAWMMDAVGIDELEHSSDGLQGGKEQGTRSSPHTQHTPQQQQHQGSSMVKHQLTST